MEWACRRCGRTYHEAPEGDCRACGHPAVVPAEEVTDDPDAIYDRIRATLFEPSGPPADLLGGGGLVSVAFRLIVGLSAVLLVAFGVSLLL